MTETRRLAGVWIVLLALTFGSVLAEESTGTGSVTALVIIAAAAVKIRLIGLYFMNVSHAPRGLRIAFEAYVVMLFVGLVGIDLLV